MLVGLESPRKNTLAPKPGGTASPAPPATRPTSSSATFSIVGVGSAGFSVGVGIGVGVGASDPHPTPRTARSNRARDAASQTLTIGAFVRCLLAKIDLQATERPRPFYQLSWASMCEHRLKCARTGRRSPTLKITSEPFSSALSISTVRGPVCGCCAKGLHLVFTRKCP